MKRRTILDIQAMKGQTPISMLTAYDYPTAAIIDESGVDMMLVGDSVGNVLLGYPNTLGVSLDAMIHHGRAVSLAAKQALVVVDMPFGSYQASPEQAVRSGCTLMAQTNAQALKLEGGAHMAPTVRALVKAGIPVMGHVGLTPQSVHQLGGFKAQGKTQAQAEAIIEGARALQDAGAFSIVLECMPETLAAQITTELSIPTIGIGSGEQTDGQVLVFHDLMGYTTGRTPSFVRPLDNLRERMGEVIQQYIQRTKARQ